MIKSKKQKDNTRLSYHFFYCFIGISWSFTYNKLGKLGNAGNKLEWQENVKDGIGVVS